MGYQGVEAVMSRSYRPRIGVDADEVLFDFSGHCLRIINRILGTRYGRADATEWDFGNLFKGDAGARKEFRARLDYERTASMLAVLPEAGPLLDALEKLGDVWVVTSPMHTNQTWVYDRMMALHALGVDRHRIHSASDKSSFDGIVLIDDYAKNLHQWEDGAVYPAERRGILWERPWSGQWAGWRANGANRVSDVVEMVQYELARRGIGL
jgi:5'(3')-deoxyribonucleotidase